MAIPSVIPWPSNLPECAVQWSDQYVDPRIRTKMDVGPPKTRRRFTKDMAKVSVTFEGEDSLYADFKDFYRISLSMGFHFFTFLNPMDATEHTYRFVSPPTFNKRGGDVHSIVCQWEEVPVT